MDAAKLADLPRVTYIPNLTIIRKDGTEHHIGRALYVDVPNSTEHIAIPLR